MNPKLTPQTEDSIDFTYLSMPLNQYENKEPQASVITYQFPLKSLETSLHLQRKLMKEIGPTEQLGQFTIELGSPAHRGPHFGAIDFIVPENTEILAAADGQVVKIIDQWEIPWYRRIIGKLGLKNSYPYRKKLNQVVIRHQEAGVVEFTRYCHLKKGSGKVKEGETVRAGQTIGQVGWSGWMDRPHLHWQVCTKQVRNYPNEKFETLNPRWQDQS